MMIRLGIPASFQRFSAVARDLNAPVLVSANALRRRAGGFRQPSIELFSGCNVALDSAGFVAMVRYRGYPWSTSDYVRLAKSHPWAWWAAMDYCCEPEVARDRAEVRARIASTVRHHGECCACADDLGVAAPLPVLQGWFPDDYERCVDQLDVDAPLIGVGSVCRREPAAIEAIVNRLDAVLPSSTRLHLFGVKGSSVAALRGHRRVASVDSMAWDYEARRNRIGRFSVDWRASVMRRWYRRHVALLQGAAAGVQMELEV